MFRRKGLGEGGGIYRREAGGSGRATNGGGEDNESPKRLRIEDLRVSSSLTWFCGPDGMCQVKGDRGTPYSAVAAPLPMA